VGTGLWIERPIQGNIWPKKKNGDRKLGCRLQVGGAENGLLAAKLRRSKAVFSVARPCEQFKVLGVLSQSKDAMRVNLF
jgi:hypothetical protein